jgi:large subunit ribosomal protein L6
MSRIGKHPVEIPGDVKVVLTDQRFTAKGKLGELSLDLVDDVEVTMDGDKVWVRPRGETIRSRKMWGTTRSLLGNIVTGVSTGFTRKLEINGVGYRAQVQGKDLLLQLGYSHEVRYPIVEGISIACPDQTHIVVTGADKQRVGQTAAEIRKFRPPEPYKGKGIKYDDEFIVRKEGKKK